MAEDGQDWRRLGMYVSSRRNELGLTQAAVQANGGPSVATQRQIESGANDGYRGGILSRLEQALGWRAGSASAVLAGGEPTDRHGAPTMAPTAPAERGDVGARLTEIRDDPDMPGYLRRQAQAALDAITALMEASEAERHHRRRAG